MLNYATIANWSYCSATLIKVLLDPLVNFIPIRSTKVPLYIGIKSAMPKLEHQGNGNREF